MAHWLEEKKIVFCDGGMGSLLMKRGMTPGMRTDEMNQAHPEAVESIHRAYAEAGSDILYTNTFSLSSRLAVMADEELDAAVADAVAIARRAAEGRALAALDVGPTGEFMEPYGALTYGIAYSRFRRLAVSGERAGADLICVETMSAPDELRAAVTAAAENTKLDIVATMTFAETGLTYTGFSIEEFGEMANGLPLLAAGVNCSRDPEQMLPAITRLARILRRPLVVKLNAGLPDGQGRYSVGPEEYAEQLRPYRELGVRIVGGCCGTTPEYIRAVKRAMES
ncbi:MAG: homocysteine S-methyltransferase family protein [Oscillospiraceae bacterium]|nr:homocysteine S-methyltransferase family protein [Oscillospiraceae bacterium]